MAFVYTGQHALIIVGSFVVAWVAVAFGTHYKVWILVAVVVTVEWHEGLHPNCRALHLCRLTPRTSSALSRTSQVPLTMARLARFGLVTDENYADWMVLTELCQLTTVMQ